MGDPEHIYQGVAAEDFLIVGFWSIAQPVQVFQLGSATQNRFGVDSSTGVVVVAMDTPSLAPAVGAQAELVVDGNDFDKSFIFGPAYPELGDTIISGGGSFVFFPNVPAGTAEITATGANGTSCRSAPAGPTSGRFTVDVEPDTVSVAVFVVSDKWPNQSAFITLSLLRAVVWPYERACAPGFFSLPCQPMAEETALAPSIFVAENVSNASSSESLNVVDDGPDLLIGKHPLNGWHWTVHTLSTTLSNDLVQVLTQVVTRERKTNFNPDPIEWARRRTKGQPGLP